MNKIHSYYQHEIRSGWDFQEENINRMRNEFRRES